MQQDKEREAPEAISIVGTVVKDGELNRTEKGKLYTRLQIAADEVTIGGKKADPKEHKWQNAVFWGVDAYDKAEIKQGTVVKLEGDRVVRQVESSRDGQMREFAEVHHGRLEVKSLPRERVSGVPIETKGEVLYDPELKSSLQNKFYTLVTIRPEQGHDKLRAVFFGEQAMDVARNIRKGNKVSLKGELVEREYTNREGEQTKGYEVLKAELQLEKARSAERSRSRQKDQQPEQGVER